jgi:chaperonin GroEL
MKKVGEAQITHNSLLLIDGRGCKEKIEKRLKQITNEIESISLTPHSSESITSAELERERLKARFAKLTNGVAIIKVGGLTELHVNEKIDIIVDALNATKCAISEGKLYIKLKFLANYRYSFFKLGFIPGGGVGLLRTLYALNNLKIENEDQEKGVNIIRSAIKIPAIQIANNAGRNGCLIVEKILDHSMFEYGYDAQNDNFVDLIKSGIIDPTKV